MPTFNPEKPFGEKFTADNDTQAGFISFFAELSCSESPPQGEDLLSEIREALTPALLVHPEICKKLPIYGKVKQFLEKFGVQLPATEESGNLVAKRIICKVWGEDEFSEDRKFAFDMFDAHRAGNRQEHTRFNASSSQSRTNINNNMTPDPRTICRQVSNDVAKRFTNQSSKFSGESAENWLKYLESYERMSIELELSAELKVKLFHHILRDHALEHFRDNIEGKTSVYEEIVALMEKEFCSKIKMETIARKLETLHISQLEDKEKSEDDALKEVAKTIQELCPQAPTECRTDRYKKKILYDATCGKDWALNVSSSSNYLNLSYQQFLHELQNSLTQFQIHNNHVGKQDDGVSYREDRIFETNFTGQSRYLKNHSHKKNKDKDKLNKCWNCERPNCTVNKCRLPRNERKIRINRIKHFEAKNNFNLDRRTKEALFQFSVDYIEEEDNYNGYESESGTDNDQNGENKDDGNIAEIQHILTGNQDRHLDSMDDIVGF